MTTSEAEKAIIKRISDYQRDRGSTDIHLFSTADMSRWEWKQSMNGERSLRVRELIGIAKGLGVSLNDLTDTREKVR